MYCSALYLIGNARGFIGVQRDWVGKLNDPNTSLVDFRQGAVEQCA